MACRCPLSLRSVGRMPSGRRTIEIEKGVVNGMLFGQFCEVPIPTVLELNRVQRLSDYLSIALISRVPVVIGDRIREKEPPPLAYISPGSLLHPE